ncbi:TetR/AcrR family transcriptional regulator [Nocardia sienata]|uniref:TetR/AcrR family transcriptional regulator n=1 Tax=Nocardia sienata TaxID=248552 RepID=UPI0007A41607|nr:TetR/AcrR family transcriptional regulator [Nocardia sienata]
MPRLVDHEARRREITDAVRRVIVSGGPAAVTFQTVAAEAGISVRLVQYYFGTKKEFLLATHQSVVYDAGARLAQRMATRSGDTSPREVIRMVLIELLPLDEQRREEAIVLGAFNTAAIAGQGITADETLTAPRALVAILADQFGKAGRAPGPAELDAELVLAAIAGIAQGMLPGHYTAHTAVELVDRLLDLTLGPGSKRIPEHRKPLD